MKKLIICAALILAGCTETPEMKKESCRVMAWVISTSLIERQLKSPSSARFPDMPDAEVLAMADSTFVINGYVDAQNSFGATIRKGFFCELKYKGGDEDSLSNWQVVRCFIRE